MKIFNKSRLKMINKSKVWNYFLYAIGEVILVVIGILLAIQLDDINNESTQATERIELLKNLKADLQKDINRLSMLIGSEDPSTLSLEDAITNGIRALDLSYQEMTGPTADSMLNLAINAGKPLLNTETSVYDQLKSTGKLYNLGSENLKSEILEYYTRAVREEAYNKNNNDRMEAYALQCIFLKVIDADRLVQTDRFNIRNYQWLFNNQSEEMKLYRAYLYQNINSQKINLRKMQALKELASALQEKIQHEIDKRLGNQH